MQPRKNLLVFIAKKKNLAFILTTCLKYSSFSVLPFSPSQVPFSPSRLLQLHSPLSPYFLLPRFLWLVLSPSSPLHFHLSTLVGLLSLFVPSAVACLLLLPRVQSTWCGDCSIVYFYCLTREIWRVSFELEIVVMWSNHFVKGYICLL